MTQHNSKTHHHLQTTSCSLYPKQEGTAVDNAETGNSHHLERTFASAQRAAEPLMFPKNITQQDRNSIELHDSRDIMSLSFRLSPPSPSPPPAAEENGAEARALQLQRCESSHLDTHRNRGLLTVRRLMYSRFGKIIVCLPGPSATSLSSPHEEWPHSAQSWPARTKLSLTQGWLTLNCYSCEQGWLTQTCYWSQHQMQATSRAHVRAGGLWHQQWQS
jgi:hypothetical protein